MDFRPILFTVGIVLSTLSAVMLVPAFVDVVNGYAGWRSFLLSAAVTLFVGGALTFSTRIGGARLKLREAFLLTTALWLVTGIFAALPFVFADLDLSYTDAFFEAMSGITTTGSTVIVGLDLLSPGLLLWRALLQWLGGVGIIVTAVAVLPALQVGGMQLFRMESSDRSEKALPRAGQIATGIGAIYLALTGLCAFALWLAGMSPLEAIAHAMSTIATGGFSTSDQSIGYFDSALVDGIVVVGMLIGGLPFVLYLQAVRGHPQALLRDKQVHWFLGIVAIAVATMAISNATINGENPVSAFHHAAFNVVSTITGTGFATTDYGAWGHFATAGFFFLMFIGGCAGSTTCGIKVFRFQVLYAAAKAQAGHLVHPHGVFIPYYNRKPVPREVVESVMAFFFFYAVSFAGLAILLGLIGLDFLTALSGAATAISNVGPGLGGVIGPAGSFVSLPDTAKWVLTLGMLLGRLEIFTILVLVLPSFWRK